MVWKRFGLLDPLYIRDTQGTPLDSTALSAVRVNVGLIKYQRNTFTARSPALGVQHPVGPPVLDRQSKEKRSRGRRF